MALIAKTYNSADLPISITYPDDSVVISEYLPQMAINKLYTIPENPYVSSTNYDASGRVLNRSLNNNNFIQSFAYNLWTTSGQGGRLNHTTYAKTADNTLFNDLSYLYQVDGNISTVSPHPIQDPLNPLPEELDGANRYNYDSISRLAQDCQLTSDAICDENEINTYGYDSVSGNLTINNDITLSYSPTTQPHAATSATGGGVYTYDTNGNQITRIVDNVSYTLTYDAENRLVKIHETDTNPEVVTGQYIYDGDGNRIKTIAAGKTTYYIRNYYEKIVEGTNTTIKKYYYAGGVRVAMDDNGQVRYFITDHLGSTTKMINTDGSEYSDSEEYFEIKYLSWGSDQPNTPDLGTSFKYTGQRQAEAGLYFYNARWYDPKIGRFIQADTVIPEPDNPLAWDRYSYTLNNPINLVDPSGHIPCDNYDAAGRCITEPGSILAMRYAAQPRAYNHKAASDQAKHKWGKGFDNTVAAANSNDTVYCPDTDNTCTCTVADAVNKGMPINFRIRTNVGADDPQWIEYQRAMAYLKYLQAIVTNPDGASFTDIDPNVPLAKNQAFLDWISSLDLQEGDIVFFHNHDKADPYNHVAVITGFDTVDGINVPLITDSNSWSTDQQRYIYDTNPINTPINYVDAILIIHIEL
jgi:RHS repeat-associated protein